jgi:nitrogen fixation protein FixH
LLCTFGVVFAVNGFFIARAIATYPGEDVQNPYLQGVDFNQTLQARAEQAAEGWQATIAAKRVAGGAVEVTIVVDKKAGVLPADFSLTGLLRHPSDEELDHPLSFAASGPNRFVGHITGVRRGAWDVQVKANGRVAFEASRRVWLP